MFVKLSGDNIVLGNKIAKGGEGEVYEVEGKKNICVKIYYENLRTESKEDKLKFMIENPPLNIEGENHKICWPKDILYKDKKFVGFIMVKAFEGSLLPYHLCQPKISNELDNSWKQTFDRKTSNGLASRLKLCVNITSLIHKIHETRKYVVVDLKPQNLLVTVTGKVSIIDLDSIQISLDEKVLFKAPVSTPEYAPPEASQILKNNEKIKVDWDIFSLGVLIYELLCGLHPYVGSAKPPNDNLNTIQEKIKQNITHVTKGKESFSILPIPHESFYCYSEDLKNIFKTIFKPLENGESKRPLISLLGETLFKEVSKASIIKEKENEIINRKEEEQKLIRENTSNNLKITAKKLSLDEKSNNEKNNSSVTIKDYSALVAIIIIVVISAFALVELAHNRVSDEVQNDKTWEKEEWKIPEATPSLLMLVNDSNEKIWVAIGYVDCDSEYHYLNKKSTGWYNIDSGSLRTLNLKSILKDEKFFKCRKLWLYAESDNSYWGGQKNNDHFLVHDSDGFNYYEWLPASKRNNKIKKKKFFEIKLDKAITKFTFND